MSIGRRGWLLIAMLACAPLAVTWVAEWTAVDSCLDAGGSYDYAAGACDRFQSHQLIPFTLRHRAFVRVTAAVVLAFVLIGLYTGRRLKRAAP